MGCGFRSGHFLNYKPKTYTGSYLQIGKDGTYRWQYFAHWYARNSFGTWTKNPNKKNSILLKSSSSDYTHIPIYVKASHQEKNGTIIILSQGKQFYNCEFNEVLINGKNIPIDKDTIVTDCHVDSLCVRLGFSEEAKKGRLWVLYDVICSDVYYNNVGTQDNVFEISLPEYPFCEMKPRSWWTHTASDLFQYLPIETEAYYRNGKWYLIDTEGEPIPFKRYRVRRK